MIHNATDAQRNYHCELMIGLAAQHAHLLLGDIHSAPSVPKNTILYAQAQFYSL